METTYYVRVTWMVMAAPVPQIPAGGDGRRPPPQMVPCYVEVSSADPPATEGFEEVRKGAGEVIRDKVRELQQGLITPSLKVGDYAQDLFEALVVRFPDREVRVDTPECIFRRKPWFWRALTPRSLLSWARRR